MIIVVAINTLRRRLDEHSAGSSASDTAPAPVALATLAAPPARFEKPIAAASSGRRQPAAAAAGGGLGGDDYSSESGGD